MKVDGPDVFDRPATIILDLYKGTLYADGEPVGDGAIVSKN
jgi:hypothetical protein